MKSKLSQGSVAKGERNNLPFFTYFCSLDSLSDLILPADASITGKCRMKTLLEVLLAKRIVP